MQAMPLAPRQLLVYQPLSIDMQALLTLLTDNWLVVSDDPNWPKAIATQQTKSLLGQTLANALFDARQSFNLEALARLIGTMQAGSTLLLLLPPGSSQLVDGDSVRWNQSAQAIATPNFWQWLQSCLQQQITPITQYAQLQQALTKLVPLPATIQPPASAIAAQQQLLKQILQAEQEVVVVTAKRGRGKSALAGLLTQQVQCWYTAPNRAATVSLRQFANADTPFYAPDQLLAQLDHQAAPDWLIIDEAAMIPLPLLQSLLAGFKRVLLTTTIEGYEGTGQGFVLKLLPQQRFLLTLSLNQPMRWAENDPLERFIDRLLFNQPYPYSVPANNAQYQIQILTQAELLTPPTRLWQSFQLLKSAHYRTTPTDLRRLLDAEYLQLLSASQQSEIVGLLLSLPEGGLAPDLIEAIWQGHRRPKGNLVAQALVAQAGERQAAQLLSWRINRLAVQQLHRQQSLASQMLTMLARQAVTAGIDYLSVSFAYTPELFQFWQHRGFVLVQVGSYRDTNSGSYAVMMLQAISAAGQDLVARLHNKLQRNWIWQQQLIDLTLPISITAAQQLNADDWQALRGFAQQQRSLSASYAALQRLRLHLAERLPVCCPLLHAYLIGTHSLQQLIAFYHLSGKNAFIQRLRDEVNALLFKE